MNGQNPRQIAARVLWGRKATGEFTEKLLEPALANSSLSTADRRLCQELVYGIIRWQATIDWLIAQKTNGREQKSGLQNLLRLGLYQIFWLDRIPAHAAVHETVELARRGGFGRQAGFVNAFLRSYLRESDVTRKRLAELQATDPALGWSHPAWLVARWQKRFGAVKTAQLLEWNNTPPTTFARMNSLKTSAGKLIEKWREENVEYDFFRRGWLAENLVFELKCHPPLASLGSFRDGWFYVQDPGTLLAATELDPQPGETILDLCAAPGGKTTFLAQLMNNRGKIIAGDSSEARLNLLRENCRRLGVDCAEFQRAADIVPGDATELGVARGTPSARFDRVLLDAPCSNTGVMRRRVDLRWRITPEEICRLRGKQWDLLMQAPATLKSGGVLVYSTCSLEPEENFGVVNEFLREHPNFKLESERELLPFTDHVDGAYVAKLKCAD